MNYIESLKIEKKNLINILKLVVKDLIEISFQNTNRYVDRQSTQLLSFYDVFENVLNHGFKGRKLGIGSFNLNTFRKDFSCLFDYLLQLSKVDSNNSLNSIKEISEIK